jgi:hypothetical protein
MLNTFSRAAFIEWRSSAVRFIIEVRGSGIAAAAIRR